MGLADGELVGAAVLLPRLSLPSSFWEHAVSGSASVPASATVASRLGNTLMSTSPCLAYVAGPAGSVLVIDGGYTLW